MNPKLEETIVLDFTTHSPTTGGVSDADSTPSVDVFEDTTDTAILTPTPVKRTGKTGNYRVSVACTAANGFEAGKSYNVVASATVGGVTGKGVVGSIQLRTRSTDDVLPTSSYTAPPSAASIRSEIDANSTKLDVTVGSRLSTAGYTAPNNAGISSILTAVDTEVAAILAAVDTEVAAIKAKTDALPADTSATLTALTALVDDLESRLTAVRAGLLDNLINLDAAITSRLAPGTPGNTIDVDASGAVVLQPGGVEVSLLTSDALNQIRNKFLVVNDSLNAPTVGANTVTLSGSYVANNDALIGATLAHFTAAGLLVQFRTITDYDDATQTVTVDRDWTVSPADTDTICIYEFGNAMTWFSGIRKSQAFGNFKFAMISTTTGEGLPGLTVTAQRVLGSGSLESCSNSPVEISAGFYRINFASADLSDDCCGFLLTAPGARPVFITLVTQP